MLWHGPGFLPLSPGSPTLHLNQLSHLLTPADVFIGLCSLNINIFFYRCDRQYFDNSPHLGACLLVKRIKKENPSMTDCPLESGVMIWAMDDLCEPPLTPRWPAGSRPWPLMAGHNAPYRPVVSGGPAWPRPGMSVHLSACSAPLFVLAQLQIEN